jgi:hypothetical protein
VLIYRKPLILQPVMRLILKVIFGDTRIEKEQ